jgi:YebC/PmpR family DNA-binding regulatory protein
MSGHSKWSQIKRKKGAADAKRGQVFTKLIKEITVAARFGGGDPEGNARLRTAIAAAKAENMPKDNIERAIKKGTGELAGVTYEEFTYEGYGPGGAAVLVEVLTDNKNRTTAEVRHIFTRSGGNLGEAGSVAWMFHKKGYIVIDKKAADEDKLMELVLDVGAEDIEAGDKEYEVTTDPQKLDAVKKTLDKAGIKYQVAELTMYPQSTVPIDGKHAEQMLRLMEQLEEHDDVQKVYSNFDIPDSVVEQLSK